ncbi:MAG: hypothetical protein H6562_18200 [Lewinellaceae bacterium]|nr:hypothetical protein [Lewinella sp.]MCB9280828.1 hypothetical protein [Lewinellaceae bacterium]
MNATHLHLVLNHFPIVGTLIGIGVILFGYVRRSDEAKKAALWIWVIMAAIAVPVFLTGEPAEETVEELAGVSETMIHRHEEAAELAIWVMEALGVFSLLGLLASLRNSGLSRTLFLVSALLSVIAFGTMARTGYLGGQIRHSEIRTAASMQPDGTAAGGEHDEDDE